MPVERWTIISGTWFITNNRLHEIGTSGALIIANARTTQLCFYVRVEVPEIVLNATYRLVANYLDVDNYHFADVTYNGTQVTLSLYKRYGGVTELLESGTFDMIVQGGESVTLTLCLDPTLFSVCTTLPEQCVFAEPSLIEDGLQAGLGNGSALAIEYDNFLFELTAECDPECPTCAYCCMGTEPTGPLTITFYTLAPKDCPSIEGLQFSLPKVGPSHWHLSLKSDPCFGSAEIDVLCVLYGGTWESYYLTVQWLPDPNPVPCFNTQQDPYIAVLIPSNGDCDPFSITYSTVILFPEWTGTAPPGPYECCACENYEVEMYAVVG